MYNMVKKPGWCSPTSTRKRKKGKRKQEKSAFASLTFPLLQQNMKPQRSASKRVGKRYAAPSDVIIKPE